jgi:isopenicillin N synthase-like dioxygenase
MSWTRLSSIRVRNSYCMLSVTLAGAVQVNRNVTTHPHPQALRPFLPELDAFARHNHLNVLRPILRLIALSLELPEETLMEKHTFEGQDKTTIRFMRYHRGTEEEEAKSKNVLLKGHTGMPYSQQKTIALQQVSSQILAP